MYTPCSAFRRTAAERTDQNAAWNRPDRAFFAAGACHVLAFAFLSLYPDAGFVPMGLWRSGAPNPSHVYVTDGTWGFDHDGWTPEAELVAVTRADDPDADYLPRRITLDVDTFCRQHNHRPPEWFAYDPWPRAERYIARFPPPAATPPTR